MTLTAIIRPFLAAAACASALALLAPGGSFARDRGDEGVGATERIAAVVNDDAISITDAEARLHLALLSSNLPDNAEVRQRLMPQVLRSLIEERLQMQETKRLNITVTDKEVKEALGRVAEQNHIPAGEFEHFLTSHGVPVSTLNNPIRAGLAWNKLVQRKLRPQVMVSDAEIDAVLDRIRANSGKPEYLTAEIFLAVDSPSQDEEVRRTGEHLVDMMRQGAPFSAVARQFSQAAGANTGGDLGWVQAGQLSDELDKALAMLRPGMVSPPIRGATGWHIMMVRDVRTVAAGDPNETKVHVMELALPVSGGRDAILGRAQELATSVHGCDAFAERIKSGRGNDMGTLRAGDMPPDLMHLVNVLPVGEVSPPFANDQQIKVLMVCDRKVASAGLPPRDAVQANIGNERIDQLQRRYLYDLRRAAYVDVRM